MALFEVTKSYFDAWLKLIVGYTLHPMVLAAFMAFMLSVFDTIIYGDCTFSLNHIGLPGENIGVYSINGTDSNCKNSFGYMFGDFIKNNSLTQTVETFFFDINVLYPDVYATLCVSLFTLALFSILFGEVVEKLSAFAADVTGVSSMGQASISPTFVQDQITKVAKIAYHLAKAAFEARKGDVKGAMQDVKAAKDAADDKKPGQDGGGDGGKGGGGMGAKVSQMAGGKGGGGKGV
jgi:type IV secretion system protein VirB6